MDGRSTSFAGQLRPGRSIPSAGIVFRSISTAYPQGRFSGCVSVHMGLLRNRSQAQKTRRFEAAGLSLDRSCEFWTVRDRQKAIPGPLRNPSPPQPPLMRGHPLPVALPGRSAPALYASCSVAKFRTDCPRSGTGNLPESRKFPTAARSASSSPGFLISDWIGAPASGSDPRTPNSS
jgi:hypothetical protein